jgi:3-oxoacyl-[acyl-carrier protein] reductase
MAGINSKHPPQSSSNSITLKTRNQKIEIMSPPSPSQNLLGKVAIVTGASRSIGAGIALELASRGAKVAITYTSSKSDASASDLVKQVTSMSHHSGSTAAIAIKADLRIPSSAARIVEQTTQAFGPHIDILVNNAGVELVKPVQDISTDDFSFVYDLNVRAPMLMLQQVLPFLRAPGRIINIGSVGARYGFKGLSTYCSSKAALEGLTRCWAAELGAAKHTVNTVNPGPVQSELLDNIPADIVEMQRKNTPVENRLGTVDDIAQIVAWLASEESRWVSGQAFAASGGWVMY